ncbi:MAG: acyl-CoA synthetase FdrA [Anaerolineae bacterium]|nr:acyl-CoA synthetase FdrA [Anaerolineae bacterium]MCO5207130.1 acyl-CoA synthetase FdrA [Anaerolineae bacterium]
MSTMQYEIRSGAYYDSVVLMQLQKGLAALPGVEDAGVVMATPANKEVLTAAGFDLEEIAAQSDDLLIMVRSDSAESAAAALSQVDTLLKPKQSDGGVAFRPKSLTNAAKMVPDAQWVLISVPGRYAAQVADDALDLGKNVFLYSDNVPLDDEIRLKQKASQIGLLVMGPDCGTALIDGVGLGFANRVRRGNIGVVAASGTGLQAVTSAIHNLGGGVAQGIGTGGRDLKDAVGGVTALQGLHLLATDAETDVIVLVSKPPSPTVVNKLLATALTIDKPVVINFIGYAPPARQFGNLWFANSLSDAARLAVEIVAIGASDSNQSPVSSIGPTRFFRGLFSGGTLAYEATLALQAFVAPLHSNVAVGAALELANPFVSEGHTIVDLGEDDFTQGRLHPMMDNDLRIRRLRHEAADPEVGLILLDVVLGEGAHLDPASELAPVMEEIGSAGDVEMVVLVVGTDDDPQNRPNQIGRFQDAGAHVFTDPTACFAAVARALLPVPQSPITNPQSPFSPPFAAINVGLETFYDSLIDQGAIAVHVDWRPPAGGNERMLALLAKLKRS